MNIKDFHKKYKSTDLSSIHNVVSKWQTEKLTTDLLESSIATGVIVSDIILNGEQLNHLSPEVLNAFEGLMDHKADSIEEVKALIMQKYETSPQSLQGLLNKVQGQYGENIFKESIGEAAELASSGSQKGWDIKVLRNDLDEHIQVKVYNNPQGVIDHIEKVNKALENGEISDATQINFAVNSDIFETVSEKVEELELPNKIYDIGRDHSEIRGALEKGFTNIKENSLESLEEGSLLDNFFSETLGIIASATAIHAASNAFLVWKCSKEKSQAIEDTIYSSVISSGGIVASVGTRTIIAETIAMTELEVLGSLLGPVGLVASIGFGYGTREYLKRISSRRSSYLRLVEDLKFNSEAVLRIGDKYTKKAA